MGGASMGLFFMISGFVLTLGYGQEIYVNTDGMVCEACCCYCCDSFYCCIPSPSSLSSSSTTLTSPSTLLSTSELITTHDGHHHHTSIINNNDSINYPSYQYNKSSFPTRDFFYKRCVRLGPLYYLTNLTSIPIWFIIYPNMQYYLCFF